MLDATMNLRRFWGSGFIPSLVLLAFVISCPGTYGAVIPTLNLPASGTLISAGHTYAPVVLRGIKVDAQDIFKLSFILDQGDTKLDDAALKEETALLLRYFLTALTMPESDIWVNLSPYEQNRIVPQGLSDTDLGEDMLSQDYLLKQLSASLTYPESDLGKKYWQSINGVGAQRAVPFSNFNKIWIMPDNAQVYEHKDTALIAQASLKVMMEQDYLASQKNGVGVIHESPATNNAFKRSQALDTDDSFSFTFTTPGSYQYFCYVHPHMTGTIVVEAATGSNASN